MCRQRRFRWLARQTPGARRDCPPTAAFSFVAPIARLLQIEQLEQRRMLATFMVTSNVDGGAGSLREAVAMANGLKVNRHPRQQRFLVQQHYRLRSVRGCDVAKL